MGDVGGAPVSAGSVVDQLRSRADPGVLAAMGPRYGIHTDRALGVSMSEMKVVATPLGGSAVRRSRN